MTAKEYYGMEDLTIDRVMELPQAIRETRNMKCMMIDELEAMRRDIDALLGRARRIPTLDNKAHAELVNGLYQAVHTARLDTVRAILYGHI